MNKRTTPTDQALSQPDVGFECRGCGCRHFQVVYTRPSPHGVTRVRACRHCGRRIITRETVLGDPARGQYRC